MQHRIIVVETLADVPVAAAQAHWRERHAAVYAPTPLLPATSRTARSRRSGRGSG